MSNPTNEIRNFIISKQKKLKEFTDNDDLLAKRVIDSLHFVEFIQLIEKLSGIEIDIEDININDFRTINTIKRVFFETEVV